MSSSIEVILNGGHLTNDYVSTYSSNFKFRYFPGWGSGWVESIIKLISAEAEAEAWLGLAELGHIGINFKEH